MLPRFVAVARRGLTAQRSAKANVDGHPPPAAQPRPTDDDTKADGGARWGRGGVPTAASWPLPAATARCPRPPTAPSSDMQLSHSMQPPRAVRSHRNHPPNRRLAAVPSHLFAAVRQEWNMQVYWPCSSTASCRPPINSTPHTIEQLCLVSCAKHIRVECLILRRDSCLMAVQRSFLEHMSPTLRACDMQVFSMWEPIACRVNVQVPRRGPHIFGLVRLFERQRCSTSPMW